ncbi:MAG: MBL fold metallo-hydrolase [Candidatus Pelethousia sp.]|nr:MBL fold metallo-hydrolase [Candidatus Pelethousia sp.]
MGIRIHNIGGYLLNNYLLETPAGWIAIDTGYPHGEATFLRRFQKLAPLHSLQYIFLTHAHSDHAGFLARLLEKTNANVILHPASNRALLAGVNDQPPGAGYPSPMAARMSACIKDLSFPPVRVGNRAVFVAHDREQPFQAMGLPIRLLYLPGHTAGSIGLFLEETGALFCGDAAMHTVINPARHAIWIEDAAEFSRSWDKMLAIRPSKIYPSHGTPFPPRDLEKYRHFLKGRELIPPR